MGRSATFILESSDFSQTRYPSAGFFGVPLMMTIGCACSSFIASDDASLCSCKNTAHSYVLIIHVHILTLMNTTILLAVAAVRVSGNKCTNIMLANTDLHSTMQMVNY